MQAIEIDRVSVEPEPEPEPGSDCADDLLDEDATSGARAPACGLGSGSTERKIDGVKTIQPGQARNQIAMTAKGTEVHVQVRSGGAARSLTIRLDEHPAEVVAQRPSD